ncbi:MAG: hypothetical protein ACOVK2_03955 [Candidatus Fonsibacter sp.]
MAFRLRSQSPLKQEKSIEANVDFDKDEKSLSPSLTANSGAFNVKAGGTLTTKGGDFNAGLGFDKNGFSAGIGVSGMTGEKPNVTGRIGYKKKF